MRWGSAEIGLHGGGYRTIRHSDALYHGVPDEPTRPSTAVLVPRGPVRVLSPTVIWDSTSVDDMYRHTDIHRYTECLHWKCLCPPSSPSHQENFSRYTIDRINPSLTSRQVLLCFSLEIVLLNSRTNSFVGLFPLPFFFFFLFTLPCKLSIRTSPSLSPLHRFLYYRSFSLLLHRKMFIGGLNWETTDGKSMLCDYCGDFFL